MCELEVEEECHSSASDKSKDQELGRKEDMVVEEMTVAFWIFLLKLFCRCGSLNICKRLYSEARNLCRMGHHTVCRRGYLLQHYRRR